jgi:hypothetical protein
MIIGIGPPSRSSRTEPLETSSVDNSKSVLKQSNLGQLHMIALPVTDGYGETGVERAN